VLYNKYLVKLPCVAHGLCYAFTWFVCFWRSFRGYICFVITIPLILGVHNWMYFEADGYKNTCVCVMWHHRCFWCASQHVICHGHAFINTWIMPSHVTHHSTCDFVDSALLDMLHYNSKTFALYSLSTLFRSWNKWCKSYVKPTHQYCFILRLDCT
jgi:hypothetical protein